jgi:predicted nucleotidyltransferase
VSPLAELLRAAAAAFDRLGAGWFVFGAQAAILHGAARLTADVDITVALGTRSLEELLAALEEQGFASRGEKPIDFARRTRVLPVVHGGTGFPVDVVVAGPGLEERFLERREQRMLDGVCVPLVRAEDLIAMKLLAGRAKDIEDVVAVIAAQHDRLDLSMIRETLALLEQGLDRSDLEPMLDEVLRRASR